MSSADADGLVESRQPLTEEQRRRLRRGGWLIGAFALLCIGFFAAIYHVAVDVHAEETLAWGILGFAAFFALVIGWQARRVLLDLADGQALVLEGPVSGKTVRVSSRRRGAARRHHSLRLGSRDIDVDLGDFDRVHEGDRVRIHLAPHSRHVFGVEVVAADPGQVASGDHGTPEPPVQAQVTTARDEPVSQTDVDHLHRSLARELARRALLIVVSAWFFLGFALQGLWGLVLLVSPAVLLCLWQCVGVLRTLARWRADRAGGVKTVQTLVITDRQVERRRGERCWLAAGGQRLQVDRTFFDSVAVGDIVEAHRAPRTGWQLDLRRLDD